MLRDFFFCLGLQNGTRIQEDNGIVSCHLEVVKLKAWSVLSLQEPCLMPDVGIILFYLTAQGLNLFHEEGKGMAPALQDVLPTSVTCLARHRLGDQRKGVNSNHEFPCSPHGSAQAAASW